RGPAASWGSSGTTSRTVSPTRMRRRSSTSSRSEMASNPFLDATVGELLDVVAARYPDREAIVATDERITYAAFRERAALFARGLWALGVAPGDKVAIWMPNRPTWFIAQQACARLGAVVVALNPRYKAHELSYILEQSDAVALILADHLADTDYFETL